MIPESIGSLAMLRKIMLAVFAIVVTSVAARAADLAAQSRLGAVFAKPYQAPASAYPIYDYPTVYAPPVHIPPLVAGYYGKPNSYFYSPYYGGSPYGIYARLPYACGFYGYC
jgi:hypothetical protein